MGLIRRLLSIFSTSHESRLKKGIAEAKAGRPERAIELYDAVLAQSTEDNLRAQAMLNRGLAYSALGDSNQAERDLKLVLTTLSASEEVKASAREKLARLQKRVMRQQDRANRIA